MYDKEGFLIDLNTWDNNIATAIATKENIQLNEQHWELIQLARDYYQAFDISPEMRPFVKWVAKHCGKDKGRSLYLLTLFPDSPAKIISKIAGLPKPANCI